MIIICWIEHSSFDIVALVINHVIQSNSQIVPHFFIINSQLVVVHPIKYRHTIRITVYYFLSLGYVTKRKKNVSENRK